MTWGRVCGGSDDDWSLALITEEASRALQARPQSPDATSGVSERSKHRATGRKIMRMRRIRIRIATVLALWVGIFVIWQVRGVCMNVEIERSTREFLAYSSPATGQVESDERHRRTCNEALSRLGYVSTADTLSTEPECEVTWGRVGVVNRWKRA